MERSKVFVVGFPKAGTSSIQYTLSCAGLKTIHWAKYNLQEKESYLSHIIIRHHKLASSVGMLIKSAKEHGIPLLYYISDYDAFTQMDVSLNERFNYWPQLLDVPLLDKQYPNSKFIFNTRPLKKWISSINRWGDLRKRLTKLEIPGLPIGVGSKDEELIAWHNWHMNNMINYFAGRKDLLIFDIENDNPQKLANFLGISNIVWTVVNKNSKQ